MRRDDKRLTRRRWHTCEALERRTMMSGDVTVTFAGGGDLSVTGDGEDNVVRVTVPAAGTVRVAGREDTTVNGEEFIDFPGGIDDVRINTRQGGDDVVELQGPLNIGGDVTARLGEGELAVEGTLGPVDIAGDVVVRPGGLGSVFLRNDVTVRGDTRINTGAAAGVAAGMGILPDFDAATFSDPLDIDNPYFPLVPGTLYTYEERTVDEETGEESVEVVTNEVTSDTRTILGVRVRVVRAKEVLDGLLVEDTFDFHAQDDNGNVWYLGEETTSFRYDDEGNLISQSTSGSFEAGRDGARAGVIMPADPRAGDAYFQEVHVCDAIDQGEVLSRGETITTDVGTFDNVLRTRDTTAVEPDALEHKLYAAGFGLIGELAFDVVTGDEDASVNLVSATRNGQPVTQVVPPDNFNGTNATGTEVGGVRFLGDMSATAEDTNIVTGAHFAGDALLYSRADVAVRDSEFDDRLIVSGRGDAGLHDLDVDGPTLLRVRGDAFVFDSEFESEFRAQFGPEDNELVVGGSSFDALVANGGGGANTFVDGGDNDIDDLDLRRFEEEEDEDD